MIDFANPMTVITTVILFKLIFLRIIKDSLHNSFNPRVQETWVALII